MPDVVITEFMDRAVVEALAREFDLLYDLDLADDPDRLSRVLEDARCLIVRNRTPVNEVLVDSAKRLEIVGRLGVGLDNIDTEACAEHGIDVVSGTGMNSTGVAEYVVTSALWLRRGLTGATEGVRSGSWPRREYIGDEISGAVLGLVGFGAIAREVAARALALGVLVQAHDPYVPPEDLAVWGEVAPTSLETLLSTSDIISIHVPKTPETDGLIGAAELRLMRPGTLLINTSRGGLVDETALVEALRSGHLGGAALDVFRREPLSEADASVFDGITNVLLTPHIAGVTSQSEDRIANAIAEAVKAKLRHR